MAKKQDKVAENAAEADKAARRTDKADAKKEADELARDQKPLKPEAKEIGDMVKDQAPEASKKIDQAGEKMQARPRRTWTTRSSTRPRRKARRQPRT